MGKDRCIWFEHASVALREPRWDVALDASRGTAKPLVPVPDSWEARLWGGHPMHQDKDAVYAWTLEPNDLRSPADMIRNYSSVLYLNTHRIQGGEFYMLDPMRWHPWFGPGIH